MYLTADTTTATKLKTNAKSLFKLLLARNIDKKHYITIIILHNKTGGQSLLYCKSDFYAPRTQTIFLKVEQYLAPASVWWLCTMM